MNELNFLVAFLAGLASFLAPCVVPLVPAYVSFISGVSFSSLVDQNSKVYRRRVFLNSISYILGFSIIFVLLGLGATALGQQLVSNRQILLEIGGAMIIVFGFGVMGAFSSLGIFQKELRINLSTGVKRLKYLGPFFLGTTFALAWTPCIGAILGSILSLAATSKNVFQGGVLLFIYSLGITAPFLLIALTLSRSYKFLAKLGPALKYVTLISGIMLVIVGFLMLTQNYEAIASRFSWVGLNWI